MAAFRAAAFRAAGFSVARAGRSTHCSSERVGGAGGIRLGPARTAAGGDSCRSRGTRELGGRGRGRGHDNSPDVDSADVDSAEVDSADADELPFDDEPLNIDANAAVSRSVELEATLAVAA